MSDLPSMAALLSDSSPRPEDMTGINSRPFDHGWLLLGRSGMTEAWRRDQVWAVPSVGQIMVQCTNKVPRVFSR